MLTYLNDAHAKLFFQRWFDQIPFIVWMGVYHLPQQTTMAKIDFKAKFHPIAKWLSVLCDTLVVAQTTTMKALVQSLWTQRIKKLDR